MTIVQPFPSLMVVTFRPSASVCEDMALALPFDPLEEDEDALADEWPDPEELTLTELDPSET